MEIKVYNPSSLILITIKAIIGFIRHEQQNNYRHYIQDFDNFQFKGTRPLWKNKNEIILLSWINYLSTQAKPFEKKLFIEQLLEQELKNCYSLQYSRHTVLDFLKNWKEWHQPLFFADRNFLAQLIFREINHYKHCYDFFFF